MKKIALTRRNLLKIPAVALGGLALGSVVSGCSSSSSAASGYNPANTNSLISNLDPYYPGTEALGANEMRITLLGTSCIPRLAQECNSIFVEVGNAKGQSDQFVFDCGTGVVAKYQAMGIPFAKMDKIFLTHLHGDHMSDITHIYCFGPATDRRTPLYVWGPGNSGVKDPIDNATLYQDGTKEFCRNLRNMCRWHSESFSFGFTRYGDSSHLPKDADWGLPAGTLIPVVPDGRPDVDFDGYAIIPIELDWTKYGRLFGDNVAYNNAATGVKITYFPAVHDRQGSISYKLEWNGLSMIFSGDTKPNQYMVDKAGGVTVLIHEMVVPAEIWAMKNMGYSDINQAKADSSWNAAYNYAKEVQNSSHTPQGAFGYILSKMNPAPSLAVATHFQATDDTITSALTSIRNHYPTGNVTIAADLMVLNVTASAIRQRRAVVSDYSWYPRAALYGSPVAPKYSNPDGTPNPTAQLDPTAPIIPPTNPDGTVNYLDTGY